MKLVVSPGTQTSEVDERAASSDELAARVEDANRGDRDALEDILTAVAPAMLRMVRAVLGPSHPDVKDVTQEALMAVPVALGAFRGESSVTQYARQIALRTALSARRRRQSREQLFHGWQSEQEPLGEAPSAEAYQRLLSERRAALLRALLDQLPEEQAQSFAMRVLMDYTLPQIAAATDTTLNTVRSRVRLAKEKLRERLESDPALLDLLREGDT